MNLEKNRHKFVKILYFILGSVSLIVAIIGIIIPGLPAVPFLLLTAFCYVRSSKKFHQILMENKIVKQYIDDFHQKRGITLGSKVFSVVLMWVTMILSCVFFIESNVLRYIIIGFGLVGTAVMFLYLPTKK